MILANAVGSELNILLVVSGLILGLGLLLRKINQPYIIAYILAGVALGPHGIDLIDDYSSAEKTGELGLIILMFFIGMEISLPDFLSKWKIAFFGTGLQILFSFVLIFFIGYFLEWDMKREILLGFIISLSSSAVVIKFIEKNPFSTVSQNVLSILLTQDILIAPMIIVTSLISGQEVPASQITLQIVGGILITVLIIYMIKKKTISLPFNKSLEKDHELQVFAGLMICFGFALSSSLFGLSAGLGAFVAGMVIHCSDATRWLHDSLHSFRVLLVSIFFISVGMLIDLHFILDNWRDVSLIVLGVYLSNHGINAISLKLLGNNWYDSILGGSYLAQIGEFSFVLASLGFFNGMFTEFAYQMTVVIVAITIFISPVWVVGTEFVLKIGNRLQNNLNHKAPSINTKEQ